MGNNDAGMMSWTETPGTLRPYGTLVKYWCPKINWGYPSTGTNQTWSRCGEEGHWNVTDIEACVGKTYLWQLSSLV